MTTAFYGSNGHYWPHGGTPDHLLEELTQEFGPLFDPCPNDYQVDGLAISWPLNQWVFCNPPYSRGHINKWAEKCFNESKRGVKIILLIPAYTDTRYFWSFIHPSASIRFIKGRLRFKGYNGKAAAFPSILCIYQGGE